VLTLSLTLGVSASIFAVIDAVLLTPPPFSDPQTLVTVGETLADEPAGAPRAVPYATFEEWRERAGAMATIEGYDATNLTLTELGAAERVSVTDVTPGFLTMLGARAAHGRLFHADEQGQPLVIVSHAFWRVKLAADPGAVNRQVVLGGRAHTVVGVLPEPFVFGLNQTDVWRPLPLQPDQAARANYPVRVVARLSGHVSPRDLGAALDEVSQRSSPPARVVTTRMAAAIAGTAARTLGVLASAAALAVLVAFANVAGLLLVRSIDRRRELAVRTALGARAPEIARQLILEAETLVAIGVAGGVLIALWLTPAVGRLALEHASSVPNREVAVSWRVIGVLAMAAAVCAAACGLLPALLAFRNNVVDVLSRGVTPAPRELRWRRVFVTGVVALACVLLVSLTLVGRSLRHVLNVSRGFEARGVLTLQVSVPAAGYPADDRLAAFYEALQRSLQERLGSDAISMVNELPLTGDRGRRLVRAAPTDAGREAILREAGPGYFEVMGIPVFAGRSFGADDNAGAAPRVIVSRSLAERVFGRENALGRQIRLGPPNAPPAEIVGVVGDVKHRALDEEGFLPTAYLSAWRSPSRSMTLVVRSQLPESDVVAAVRGEVARLDRDVPLYRIRWMRDVVATSPGLPARRVLAATFAGFALLAVVLAGIGLFGVVAHDIASRRAELGLRIALGADPMAILLRTFRQGASMVCAGLVAGGALSMWVARALGAIVHPADGLEVASVAGAAAVMLAVGAVAVLPAARRAARTDPLSALRGD
jgi:predicted permease